ncbi:MAG: hypothetical protein K9K75_00665 [Deltaproteobacteria bacterium]|nr:hypothetical protein [Deltaproteobacteria bacterium]
MYKPLANDWIEEMVAGGKLEAMSTQKREQLAEEYAMIIEETIAAEAQKTLATMGKADEYERMKLFDGQYLNKYLNQTIPAFFSFKMEAIALAKEIILAKGKS